MANPKFCVRALVAAAFLATSLVAAAPAHADEAKCGKGQTLDHTETKVCPATPQRPAVTLERACCKNKNGKVHCQSFKKCPKKSPS